MANLTERLLKINGIDVANIVDYEVEYNKLWKDADRNMAGEVRASLIGVFPKIKVKTTAQKLSEFVNIGALLNLDYFEVEYYDLIYQTNRTARYYASDFSTKLKYRRDTLIDTCSFNLIPVEKK